MARGGFGRAPKFPPSLLLEFLLRHHARTGDPGALEMAATTCTAMARGGIYDQLAGGFARYAVDVAWVVPHFEKMLYDNALLLRVYTHWWRATGSPLAERVARETADFMLRELGTAEGGFASALDADAAGVEGLTYAWSRPQLAAVLGETDAERAADLLRVTEDGTFEDGLSTLQLPVDPDDLVLVGRRPGPAARRPRGASPATPRRQGGHRLERAGRRGPGRPGRAVGRPALRRGGDPGGGVPPRHAPGRRPAAPVLAWGRGRQRGGRGRRLRRPGRGPAGPAPGHRRATLAPRRRGPPRRRPGPLRRAGRRVPRHRRRRRGALHPSASAGRQRRAVRDDVGRPAPC